MAIHRGRQCRTFLDVLADLAQHLLKIFVLLLLRQNVETLNERQTRVNHHGELPRKDREISRLHALPAGQFGNADLAALFFHGHERDLLASQRLAQRLAVIGHALARNNLVQPVLAFKNVSWHFLMLRSEWSLFVIAVGWDAGHCSPLGQVASLSHSQCSIPPLGRSGREARLSSTRPGKPCLSRWRVCETEWPDFD